MECSSIFLVHALWKRTALCWYVLVFEFYRVVSILVSVFIGHTADPNDVHIDGSLGELKFVAYYFRFEIVMLQLTNFDLIQPFHISVMV